MTLEQIPDSLSFLGNIKDFRIISETDTTISLSVNDNGVFIPFFKETLTPESGIITISLNKLLEEYFFTEVPLNDDSYKLQPGLLRFFEYSINDIKGEFSVIRGGLDNLPSEFEIDSFLRYNFLTWQPQEKKIIIRQPEWLTHYFQTDDRLMIRLYFKEDGEIKQSDQSLFIPDSYNLIYTVNVSFPFIASLYPSINIFFYDVFIANKERFE
jgi:hypothetical protein